MCIILMFYCRRGSPYKKMQQVSTRKTVPQSKTIPFQSLQRQNSPDRQANGRNKLTGNDTMIDKRAAASSGADSIGVIFSLRPLVLNDLSTKIRGYFHQQESDYEVIIEDEGSPTRDLSSRTWSLYRSMQLTFSLSCKTSSNLVPFVER
jgi:hypothetical protein